MPDLDTNYVRERQPPCDCGTCKIWKSLHDEALAEVDRLTELGLQEVAGGGMSEHQQEQGMMDDDSGIADLDTNEVRESIPIDIRQHYWIQRLLECLVEIDRLREERSRLYEDIAKANCAAGLKDLKLKDIEQRIQKACAQAAVLEMIEIDVSWEDRQRVMDKIYAIDSAGGKAIIEEMKGGQDARS